MDYVGSVAGYEGIIMRRTPDQLDVAQGIAHGLAAGAHVGRQVHHDGFRRTPVDRPVYGGISVSGILGSSE